MIALDGIAALIVIVGGLYTAYQWLAERSRRAKQKSDIQDLLAHKARTERGGGEAGSLLAGQIGAHFGMTEAEVLSAIRGDAYIEFFEDSGGHGTRLRYVGKSTLER
jgi:hypothetical protein